VGQATRTLTRLLLGAIPALLLLISLTTWLVVGRALRPIELIRREVEAISTDDLHRRVPEPRTRDEVGRLARTMNRMLGRLEAASERQRRFVADASHELRSPLTGIRAQLEVDLAHPQLAAWQTTERDVLDETLRMQRLVDDLLILTRADSATLATFHERVDLGDVVLTEVHRLSARTELRVDSSGVISGAVDGDPDQLTRLVRNLLDNAERFASSLITVAVKDNGDIVVLTVADDGPGIPQPDSARMFERFTRLDRARARDDGGVGLGLSIAAEIAAVHGACITIDDNLPGARLAITFPSIHG
jgi:signal transduction histidine kinase